jgi:polysaccharide pyruvyl transferase WcaK-like protein
MAILNQVESNIVFLPMQPPGDVALSNEVAGQLGMSASVVRTELSPEDALAVSKRLSGLVAMRLHALIFGAMSAIPIVALSYDPKVSHFMERLGQKNRSFALRSNDGDTAAGALAEAISEGDELREDLQRRSLELREHALTNVDRALALCS